MLVAPCTQARSGWDLALEQANVNRKWQGSTPDSTVPGHQLMPARAEFGW
jgi:hypothetical protein